MRKKILYSWAIVSILCIFNSYVFATSEKRCCRAGDPCQTSCASQVNPLVQGYLIPAYRSERPKQSVSARSSVITIEQSDIATLMSPGNSELMYTSNNSVSFSMDIGSANSSTPQNWVLPNNILSMMAQRRRLDFINLATVTPAAAQVEGATHVYKQTLNDDGVTYTNYHFFNLDNEDLEDWGQNHVNVLTNEVFEDDGEAPEQFSDAPLELGDAFDSHDESYDMNSTGLDTYSDATIEMDAYGTIETPFGTFDCLRGKITQNYDVYDANTGDNLSSSTSYYVFWVTKEGFRFYAEVLPTAAGSTTITDFKMHHIFNTAVLPVELLEFKGQTTDRGNFLTWTTANEKNNAGFEIERSTDGQKFEKIGFVKGNNTTQDKNNYSFTDNPPLSKIAYYRLQQVDFDGSKMSSNIISIELKDFAERLKVYPNPTNGHEITLEIPENTEGVQVINSLGQVVFNQKVENMKTLKMDTNQWANGIYFIKTAKENIKLIKN